MHQQQLLLGEGVSAQVPVQQPSSTPVQTPLPVGVLPSPLYLNYQTIMPAAFAHRAAPSLGQQLTWDSAGQQYMSENIDLNFPPGYRQQQQQQSGHLQAILQQQVQPPVLQQWYFNSPVTEQQVQHRQLQPQQVQHSPAQAGFTWTHLEQRPDQIPFWQSPQAAMAGVAAGSTAVAAAAPAVQHVQLQQGTLVPVQPQQLNGVLQLQPQLQTQVLQYAPQQQLQLQEMPAYALLLLPPGASVIGTPQQQLQLQPVLVPQELLVQTTTAAAAGMQAAPTAAHRKTRRGPNRGRSKQKKAEQQAAAEAGNHGAVPDSLQETHTELQEARVTSASSSSGPTADSNGYSGSGILQSQGGSADSAASAGGAGVESPDKKRMRRRGRRGNKDRQDAEGSQQEQHEGQAIADPLLLEGTAGAAVAESGDASSSLIQGVQQQAGQVAAGQQLQQQVKRTSGLSHRQRYRRKQWELHRAMEEQRADAEAQAQLQAQQLLLLQCKGRVQVLAAPQQLPPVWQERQAVATSQLTAGQQLQGSPVTPAASAGLKPAGQLHGSCVAEGMPLLVAAIVPAEAQRGQLLPAAAAAGVHADSAVLAPAAATGTSWATGSQQQQQLQWDGQAAEGAAHVDHNLDEWLSKLLEL